MRALGISLRLAAATVLFLVAASFAVRSWWPLGHGYFSEYPDSSDGLYFTMAGIGVALAAIFATAGLLILSPRFRAYGGFVLLAAAAATASVLPYMLFKWHPMPHTWPWAVFVEDFMGWLRFRPLTRGEGIAIQIALGLLVLFGVAAQLTTWRLGRAQTRRAARAAPIAS